MSGPLRRPIDLRAARRAAQLQDRYLVGQRRTPHVAVGYPYGGGVTGPFLESLMRLQRYELAKPEPLLWHLLPQSGLYIGHNRNRIAEKFWTDTDADWLLQIDSDIEFPATVIEQLLTLAGPDRKVIAASVPLGPPFGSCGWNTTSTPGVWACLPSEEILPDGTPVDGVATALMMVHRDVIRAIAETAGQCWFLDLPPEPRLDDERSRKAWTGEGPMSDRRYIPQGEDLVFCLRAKAAGFQPWVAKIPGLKHHKTLPMSHDYESELMMGEYSAPPTAGSILAAAPAAAEG